MGRRRDPVSPDLRIAVFTRDGDCVAPRLDPDAGPCRGPLTADHVKDEPRMGVRAPSDAAHLVTLCEGHHLDTRAGANWATSHRPELREYLRRVERPVAA